MCLFGPLLHLVRLGICFSLCTKTQRAQSAFLTWNKKPRTRKIRRQIGRVCRQYDESEKPERGRQDASRSCAGSVLCSLAQDGARGEPQTVEQIQLVSARPGVRIAARLRVVAIRTEAI